MWVRACCLQYKWGNPLSKYSEITIFFFNSFSHCWSKAFQDVLLKNYLTKLKTTWMFSLFCNAKADPQYVVNKLKRCVYFRQLYRCLLCLLSLPLCQTESSWNLAQTSQLAFQTGLLSSYITHREHRLLLCHFQSRIFLWGVSRHKLAVWRNW